MEFKPSARTVGAEYELQLLDARTLDLADAVESLLAGCPDPRHVTCEYFQPTVEIAVLLTARDLPGLPDARWIGTAHETLAATEHLNELRQFTGVLALTYRSWEAA